MLLLPTTQKRTLHLLLQPRTKLFIQRKIGSKTSVENLQAHADTARAS